MSQSTYSRIENKQVALTVETGKRIATILRCHLDDLLPKEVFIENKDATPEEQRLMKLMDDLVQKHMDKLKDWVKSEMLAANAKLLSIQVVLSEQLWDSYAILA